MENLTNRLSCLYCIRNVLPRTTAAAASNGKPASEACEPLNCAVSLKSSLSKLYLHGLLSLRPDLRPKHLSRKYVHENVGVTRTQMFRCDTKVLSLCDSSSLLTVVVGISSSCCCFCGHCCTWLFGSSSMHRIPVLPMRAHLKDIAFSRQRKEKRCKSLSITAGQLLTLFVRWLLHLGFSPTIKPYVGLLSFRGSVSGSAFDRAQLFVESGAPFSHVHSLASIRVAITRAHMI